MHVYKTHRNFSRERRCASLSLSFSHEISSYLVIQAWFHTRLLRLYIGEHIQTKAYTFLQYLNTPETLFLFPFFYRSSRFKKKQIHQLLGMSLYEVQNNTRSSLPVLYICSRFTFPKIPLRLLSVSFKINPVK